ncbi:YycH family regulatory protein [Paenibacillus contaminans]|uniref:Regulatory protein YycH domain-containing protein n=1 Tax=Paenibacillus contaminans TaxID=450362 RepID=A0A329MID3_9BACL|nr:two-component system activity regulator YycH [Paenibacillus contaminans]RAV19480.1 hypothetical protein DQG23_21055 [Paenibacillus contaminans]
MEKFKSVLLTLLVALSLVQSYLLAYGTPKFEPIAQDYVETRLDGTQAELSDLLYPSEIVLHFGKKSHTVLPFDHQFYERIYNDLLKRRTFDGLRKTNLVTAGIHLEDIRNNQVGFEVRFKDAIPLNILQTMLRINEDLPTDNDYITKIWIYIKDNKEDVKTYFFTETGTTVYEVVKADVLAKDVEKAVGFGEFLTKYHSEDGDFYLPEQPIAMAKIRMPYTQFTADQLKRSLFVDPGLTRFLQERDGSQIYTDSKKGLQIKPDQRWFSYSDPIFTPAESRSDVKGNLLSGIQFVNQHGGWNSKYMLSKITPKQSFGPQTFIFRQFIDNVPIINSRNENFGYIKVVLQKGVLSNYERSTVIPDLNNATRTEASLPGGKELDDMISLYPRRVMAAAIFPAYQAVVTDQYIELIPRWAVELRDGTFEFL